MSKNNALHTISGISFIILNRKQYPAFLQKTLDVFLETHPELRKPELYLCVMNGQPQDERKLLRCGSLSVFITARDEWLFRPAPAPKCALTFRKSTGHGTLWLYEGVPIDDPDLSEQARVLLRMAFETVASPKGMLSLHASVFVHDGQAICLTGPSGAGKSTLTGHCLGAYPGAYVLNGDRPVLKAEGGVFFAYGAPWSGKEHYYVNKSAPVQAIVEVRKHCVNRVVRLDAARAYRLLVRRVSKPLWDEEGTRAVLASVEKLASSVPVYRCYCLNDASAGECLRTALEHPDEIPILEKDEVSMKVKTGFVVRKVLDEYVAMPVGADSAKAQGAVMLNDLGAFLWEKLEKPIEREALLECVLSEFDVDRQTAEADLDEFLDSLRKAGALDD